MFYHVLFLCTTLAAASRAEGLTVRGCKLSVALCLSTTTVVLHQGYLHVPFSRYEYDSYQGTELQHYYATEACGSAPLGSVLTYR